MQRTIYAHTAPGSDFPAFVSIARNDDGSVVVIARGPRTLGADGHACCGQTVAVTLPREALGELACALLSDTYFDTISNGASP